MHAKLATKGRLVLVNDEMAGLINCSGVVDRTLLDGEEEVQVRLNNGSLLTCHIHLLSTKDRVEHPMMQELSFRMLGDNFTLTRSQWEQLLFDLKPDCELHKRIMNLLKEDSIA